jgi:hypothetical protein
MPAGGLPTTRAVHTARDICKYQPTQHTGWCWLCFPHKDQSNDFVCRVAYHLQQLATANISTKVVVLSLFATPFILLFGYMYHKVAHVKFGAAMYKVTAAGRQLRLC